MKRRTFVGSISVAALSPSVAGAQSGSTRPLIGVLFTGRPPQPFADALPRELAALGYINGRNIAFDMRYGDGTIQRLDSLAAELVQLKVDVIVANQTPAVRAAKDATKSIPIVMATAGAPLETGLITSLSRPGGNITGLTNFAAELGGRRLQLLKETIPGLKRVAALASTQDLFTKPFLDYMEQAAPAAEIRMIPIKVQGPADFEGAFATMAEQQAQAVVVQGIFDPHRAAILALAARQRLAVVPWDPATTRAGGLFSLASSDAELNRRAASFIDRILKGSKPGELPVERATNFELIVNLKTAKELGLTISPTILAAAHEVIE